VQTLQLGDVVLWSPHQLQGQKIRVRIPSGSNRKVRHIHAAEDLLGANPTITSYNASIVKICNATNSLERFLE
jgi:hypothetical protein